MPIPQQPTPSGPAPLRPAAGPTGGGVPPRETPRPATPEASAPAEFDPTSGLAAVVFPGAGHIWRGEGRRGGLIAAGVLGLFFGGMLIGGIDVVDRTENPIWFLGQALVGPLAFGVDYIHQNYVKVIDPMSGRPRTAHPERRDPVGNVIDPPEARGPGGRPVGAAQPQGSKSLGRMNELGTLFATIAGMLNLIAIIDAAFRQRREA